MKNLKNDDIGFFDIRKIKKDGKENLIISYDNNGNIQSLYSDNIWDFSHKVSKNNGNIQKRFVFKNQQFSDGKYIVNDPFYLNIYKDAIYHALSKNLKINTISSYFKYFFFFLDYCYTYHNNKNFNQLTIDDVNNFVSYLKNEKRKYKSKGRIINTIKNCIFYPNFDFSFSINFEPFENVVAKYLDKRDKKEINQSKIIPDKAWQNIISKCEQFIDEFNSNIEIEDRLLKVAEDALSNQAEHRFNLFFKKKLKSDIPQYKTAKYYYEYISDLQISCGMIIQAFTGMRISELQSLRKGCIKEESIIFNGKEHTVYKIEGVTFKYQEKGNSKESEGKKTYWYCPYIVVKAIKALEKSTRIPRLKVEYKIQKLEKQSSKTYHLKDFKELLFISNKTPTTKTINDLNIIQIVDYSQNTYEKYRLKHKIELDFKLHSHCFRRTLARFLSRSLIDIEIEAIKEQFKHFSKDITLYYMREDRQLESNFAELLEEYDETINTSGRELLFDKMRNSLDSAILTANNLDELILLTNGKQLKVVNEYAASIHDSTKILSPIDCLTCEGNVIIPNVHFDYWIEMLTTYDEMIEIEPNSIWHRKEREMILDVIKTLKENKIYITGAKQ